MEKQIKVFEDNSSFKVYLLEVLTKLNEKSARVNVSEEGAYNIIEYETDRAEGIITGNRLLNGKYYVFNFYIKKC